MARDFSPISFFQRAPNLLLGRYFQDRHGALKDVAFAELDESGSTAGIIFDAFSGLPEPQQAWIEAECQDIESMAHQAGVTALIDEATEIHTPGNTKYVDDLAQPFAEAILKLGELDPFTKGNQVYKLDRLGNRAGEDWKDESDAVCLDYERRTEYAKSPAGNRA